MSLRLDYSNMMISPGGIDQKSWSSAADRFSAAYRGFDELRKKGTVTFADLPSDTRLLEQSIQFADAARGKYDDVVILGIGGSALGPIALRTALRPSGCKMWYEKESC
jgi:glucose-6-phosphate isomerase